MAMPMISHSKLFDACLPTVCLTTTIQSEQSFRPCVIGLLTLANYNGDENDNENENGDDNENENDNENDNGDDNENGNENGDENGVDNVDRNYRAADGIVSYLLLLLSLYLLLTPLILIFSFFLSSGFPSPVVSVFAFAAVASVFSSMPAILLSEF